MNKLFIVNTLSERVAKKGSRLIPIAEKFGVKPLILDPFDALPAAVTQAAKNQVEHVVIEGGDGTVQGVISAFLQQAEKFSHFPAFSIVPGGMTNQVAKNIGLKVKTQKALKRALNTQLRETKIPLLNIIDANGAEYAGFLFSTGAIPQITRYTTRQLHGKGIGGSLAVIGGILKAIRSDDDSLMQTTPVEISELHSGQHLGSVVTTLPSIMMGLDPFWGTGDAPLRITWADENYRRLGQNIFSLWAGSKSKDRSADGLYSRRVDSLTYTYQGDIVLDGEFLSIPSGKFTVRATRPVTFLN